MGLPAGSDREDRISVRRSGEPAFQHDQPWPRVEPKLRAFDREYRPRRLELALGRAGHLQLLTFCHLRKSPGWPGAFLLRRPRSQALAEHLVQLAAGMPVGEFAKRPLLRHLPRRTHEAGPRAARQRAADADTADA